MSSNLDKCEPNMTPMLDLVLQLVMFFMLCANFIAEDVNETVKLPTALQAKPLDRNEDYVIFLNIDAAGSVLLGKGKSAEKLTNAAQVRSYMGRKKDADDARITREKARTGKDQALSLVVLRGHQDLNYRQVNDVMEACRGAGYVNVQLRAIVGNGK